MTNPTLQTIAERFSCRSYTGESIDPDKLKAIVQAGLQSPSAVDQQKWRLKVITNKALIDEMNDEALAMLKANSDQTAYERIMGRGGKVYYNAPAMILVMKVEEQAMTNMLDIDCGIMVQNMALAATSVGYNSVIVAMGGLVLTGPRSDYFKDKLRVAEGETFAIGLLLGEGNMTKDPHAIGWDKVSYIN